MTTTHKERPILFSAPMVRALLDGSKTQTRRVVNQRKDSYTGVMLAPNEIAGEINNGDYSNSPYGHPGDQLWVRETWGHRLTHWLSTDWLSANHLIEYAADNEKISYPRPDKTGLPKHRNQRDDEDSLTYINYLKKHFAQWRPSIFMPRWASRITLGSFTAPRALVKPPLPIKWQQKPWAMILPKTVAG